MPDHFQLSSEFEPKGDQAQAIAKLNKSLSAGNKHQALLGVTGSGKTFTMANIIAEQNRPTLVMSHNKTLAAQLYSESRDPFPSTLTLSPRVRRLMRTSTMIEFLSDWQKAILKP